MVAMASPCISCLNTFSSLGAHEGVRVGRTAEAPVFVEIVNFVNFTGPVAPSVSASAA